MGLDWWKMHHSLLDDPAIIRTPDEVIGHWVKVLAVACRRGGTLGDLDEDGELEKLASLLRLEAAGEWDIAKAREIVATLRARRLIERIEDEDKPRNWNKFQGETEAAARMRKKRLRDKDTQPNIPEKDEHGVTDRNGSNMFERVRAVTPVTKIRLERVEEKEEVKEEKQRASLHVMPTAEREHSGLMADFHEWIGLYPRQVNTDAACREWISLVSVGEITAKDIPEIMAGLSRWLESMDWEKDDGKFVPRPDNWLRRKLWLDNPPKGSAVKSREAFPEWQPPKKRREPEEEAA